jgi:uncharacterized protein YbjT (DUF2867 family)
MTSKSISTSILVLGATGKTGRRVVSRLERRSDVRIRAACRRGPTRFDWDDERTWEPALDGVGAVYVVSFEGADDARRLGAFASLAVARGARRLVLLSARDWAVSGGEETLAGERAVQGSGADWTILRPTWFAQNFSESQWLGEQVRSGEVVLPAGDGREPFIDADDIAAVAVAALVEDGHAGEVYELSGPRLLSFGDAVEEIAAGSGRDIRFVPASAEEYAADAARRGQSAGTTDVLNMLYGWIREGRNAHLSDGVQRVLGRSPRDFSEYVREVWR